MEGTLAVSGYVSPIPAEIRTDYRKRIEGQPIKRRVHIWPQADGSEQMCNPDLCRECYREQNWKGQNG